MKGDCILGYFFCSWSPSFLTVHVFQITYVVPFSVTAELTADTGGDQGVNRSFESCSCYTSDMMMHRHHSQNGCHAYTYLYLFSQELIQIHWIFPNFWDPCRM